MIIKTKFNIGDKLYTLEAFRLSEDCPICKGEGVVISGGLAYPCYKCRYTGKVESKEFEYKIKAEQHVIINVQTSNGRGNCNINYKTQCKGVRGGKIKEEMLFRNIEEAQTKCNELNINEGE